MSYLFSGKIKCLDCGKNYRGMKERKHLSYVCSGYTNYGESFCQRYKIKQDTLIDFAKSFYEVEMQKNGKVIYDKKGKLIEKIGDNDLLGLIEKIEVSPKNKSYIIYYTNGLKGVCEPNRFSLMNYK